MRSGTATATATVDDVRRLTAEWRQLATELARGFHRA